MRNRIAEISTSENRFHMLHGAALGGAVAGLIDVVGFVVNASKKLLDKDYRMPEWYNGMSALHAAYAGSWVALQKGLIGEESECRRTLESNSNIIVSMFSKQNHSVDRETLYDPGATE